MGAPHISSATYVSGYCDRQSHRRSAGPRVRATQHCGRYRRSTPVLFDMLPHTVFSASHWTGHTAATAIGLYDVLIVPLVMAEAVSMVERLGLRTETQPRLANVRRYLAAALRGRLNVLIALILFCVAALAAVASGSWAYRFGGDHLHESPFVAAARAIMFPCCSTWLHLRGSRVGVAWLEQVGAT